ncbi:MAG: hypothetical protein JO279_03755 [Verrucomicrobia bacterium]|nr:hypothetical protein [Verrucomicrobiota bacterium]
MRSQLAFVLALRDAVPQKAKLNSSGTQDISDQHFGIMVRDEQQLAKVREKLTTKHGMDLTLRFAATSAIPGVTAFRCLRLRPIGSTLPTTHPAILIEMNR